MPLSATQEGTPPAFCPHGSAIPLDELLLDEELELELEEPVEEVADEPLLVAVVPLEVAEVVVVDVPDEVADEFEESSSVPHIVSGSAINAIKRIRVNFGGMVIRIILDRSYEARVVPADR